MTMNASTKSLRVTLAALGLLFGLLSAGAQEAGRPPVRPQDANRVQAQAQQSAGSASVRADYIDADEMPDASVFLPAPPKPGDPLFDSDLVYYEWGKSMRATERGQRAHDDAKSSLDYLAQILEPAVGVRISNESTPNLYRLLSKSMTTANNANRKAKDFYKRTRPYVEFDEPTGVPRKSAVQGVPLPIPPATPPGAGLSPSSSPNCCPTGLPRSSKSDMSTEPAASS